MLFNLGILAAVLWLNIPGIGGPIAGGVVIAIILYYPFVAFNQRSWLNIWFDHIAHRINMASLNWFDKRKARRPIKTSDSE